MLGAVFSERSKGQSWWREMVANSCLSLGLSPAIKVTKSCQWERCFLWGWGCSCLTEMPPLGALAWLLLPGPRLLSRSVGGSL